MHVQSAQNSKPVIYLKYLKKEGRHEVDFLHVDKHQTFLQVDTINLGGNRLSCANQMSGETPKFGFWG